MRKREDERVRRKKFLTQSRHKSQRRKERQGRLLNLENSISHCDLAALREVVSRQDAKLQRKPNLLFCATSVGDYQPGTELKISQTD